MILHTVNKSLSTSSSCLQSCLRLALENSAILLIEDGVYAALANKINTDLWDSLSGKHKLYVLETDLLARGISGRIHPSFEKISYAEFVELSLEYSKVQSWT